MHAPFLVQQGLQVLDACHLHAHPWVVVLQAESLTMLLMQQLVSFLQLRLYARKTSVFYAPLTRCILKHL